MLVESLTGKRAFPQNAAAEVALARLTTSPEIPAEFGYGWRSLLSAMTVRNADERPTALEIVLSAKQLAQPNNAPEATAPLTAPTKRLTAYTAGFRSDQEVISPFLTKAQPAVGLQSGNPRPTTIKTVRMTRPLDDPPASTPSTRPKRMRMRWQLVAATVAPSPIGAFLSHRPV